MCEAEKPELKTGKRIVSKGKYVALEAKRGYHRAYSIFMTLSCVGFAFLFALIVSWLPSLLQYNYYKNLVQVLSLLLATAGGAFLCARKAIADHKEANAVEKVVPLTRANTGDLPAPESLVRASVEPLQAQETVLLRAAAQGQQTPAEQLVRPAGGQGNG